MLVHWRKYGMILGAMILLQGPLSYANSALQLLSTRLEIIGGVPPHDEQDITLRATVSLIPTLKKSAEAEDVEYRWILPPDATVVSGETEDAIANLKPGQQAHIEITLNGVSKESSTSVITFQAEALAPNHQRQQRTATLTIER
jgi:hypothetical protein